MHTIRKVKADEANLISELAIRSKAHWGYDDEFMRLCRDELTHSQQQVEDCRNRYYLAENGREIVGFYKLEKSEQAVIILEALFVDPIAIGQGVGRALFEHAKIIATKLGGRCLEAQSDPFAEPFYRAMGASVVGRKESGSIADRYLPIIHIDL